MHERILQPLSFKVNHLAMATRSVPNEQMKRYRHRAVIVDSAIYGCEETSAAASCMLMKVQVEGVMVKYILGVSVL